MTANASVWHALPFGPAEDSTSHMSDAVSGDHALVRMSLGGDDGAFAELIRRHKGRVFGTCSRFARDAHQLDDLCQEVFLRAWRKLGGFRGDAPFEHWLARLTVTACYDFLRRELLPAGRRKPQASRALHPGGRATQPRDFDA